MIIHHQTLYITDLQYILFFSNFFFNSNYDLTSKIKYIYLSLLKTQFYIIIRKKKKCQRMKILNVENH